MSASHTATRLTHNFVIILTTNMPMLARINLFKLQHVIHAMFRPERRVGRPWQLMLCGEEESLVRMLQTQLCCCCCNAGTSHSIYCALPTSTILSGKTACKLGFYLVNEYWLSEYGLSEYGPSENGLSENGRSEYKLSFNQQLFHCWQQSPLPPSAALS